MRSGFDLETECQATFDHNAPYWHLFTEGEKTPILLTDEEDFAFAMNAVALAAYECRDVAIISFALMSNHFHFVISGPEKSSRIFFDIFLKKLSRTIREAKKVKPEIKMITELKYLRTVIAYVHRNGFMVSWTDTPYSYPWGSGRYWFHAFPIERSYSDYNVRARRSMFRGRDPELPDEWKVIDMYIAPPSYCAILFGQSLFRSARQYFYELSKNIEGYVQVAADTGEVEFMNDFEMGALIRSLIKEMFNLDRASSLTQEQLRQLANTLHYKYQATNKQISRNLRLSLPVVESWFPRPKD